MQTELTLGQFYKILENINLDYVLDYELNNNENWSKLLSLGEQQRLAFGRVIVAKPSMVYLDETTSALYIDNQYKMYQLLQDNNISYMSIGHRTNSLLQYHDTVLQIIGDGSWRLCSKEDYLLSQQ